MILHLGAEVSVPQGEVVAILRCPSPLSGATARFVERARAQGQVVQVPGGPAKSMVVAVDAHMRRRLFLSPISSQTLRARMAQPLIL